MMKKAVLALSVAVSMGLATSVSVASPKCGPLQEQWVFYADASGHMMKHQSIPEHEQFQSKAQAAQLLMMKIRQAADQHTPAAMSLYTMAPFAQLLMQVDAQKEDWSALLQERYNIKREVFARPALFGERAKAHFANQKGQQRAAFFVLDGELRHTESFILAMKDFKCFNPKVNCYILSLATSPEGKVQIDELTKALNAKVFDAWALLSDGDRLQGFVNEELLADCLVSLQGVHFAFDSSQLSPSAQAILTKNLEHFAAMKPTQHIEIVGWTDNYGSERYNEELSQRRADAVKQWLIRQGLNAAKIKAEGLGVSKTFDNRTGQGRALNRRIDISIETDE